MVIRIAKQALTEILSHAEATYPEECCGLLISGGSDKKVMNVVKMNNAYPGPKNDRYHIDPLELFRADREVAKKGLTIIGIYHSHPDYPAILSKFDLNHSFPWYSYVVISVPKGSAGDTKSWIPNQEKTSSAEEPIEIMEN